MILPNNKLPILQIASPVPFVDDGREKNWNWEPIDNGNRPHAKKVSDYDLFVGNDNKNTTMVFTSPKHEKYTINHGVGLYHEDWMPTYIPDGYRLLYINSEHIVYPNLEVTYYIRYFFVPNNLIVDPNTGVLSRFEGQIGMRESLYERSKGFNAGVSIHNFPKEPNSLYNTTTIDDIKVWAYNQLNEKNEFSASIKYRSNEGHMHMSVSSQYLTLEEFNSSF